MKFFLGKVVFRITRKILSWFDFEINLGKQVTNYPELDESIQNFCGTIFRSSMTMTSLDSLKYLAISCQYLEKANIPGDFVESGVWRGGSAIVARKVLNSSRNCYLFDTFEGMTEPSENDKRIGENSPENTLNKWMALKTESGSKWVASSLDEVQNNFKKFNLLSENVVFVKGDVRSTMLNLVNLPKKIALLRIDTDFYDSTLVALVNLWPMLSSGGVLILDDYGHWDGARKAVDEWLAENGLLNLLLTPITGGGGRALVKP